VADEEEARREREREQRRWEAIDAAASLRSTKESERSISLFRVFEMLLNSKLSSCSLARSVLGRFEFELLFVSAVGALFFIVRNLEVRRKTSVFPFFRMGFSSIAL